MSEERKMVTKRLTEEELGDYFENYVLWKGGTGCDMVRIPSEWPELLPDLTFSRRLPILYDGKILDPTKMIPLPLALLESILGKVPAYTVEAEMLFGAYSSKRQEFHLTATNSRHMLIKMCWDVRVPQIANEDCPSYDEAGRLDCEKLAEILGDAPEFVARIQKDDYGMYGETYLMVEMNRELRQLYERCDAATRRLLRESAERLETFEAEKEKWYERIMGVIPEDWIDVSPATHMMEETEDSVLLLVETSPVCWQVLANVRFDKIGYQAILRTFG